MFNGSGEPTGTSSTQVRACGSKGGTDIWMKTECGYVENIRERWMDEEDAEEDKGGEAFQYWTVRNTFSRQIAFIGVWRCFSGDVGWLKSNFGLICFEPLFKGFSYSPDLDGFCGFPSLFSNVTFTTGVQVSTFSEKSGVNVRSSLPRSNPLRSHIPTPGFMCVLCGFKTHSIWPRG